MKDTLLTQKQFAAMIVTSLLSPLLRSLPRATVSAAGRGAWLSVAPALGLLLAMLAFQAALLRQLRPGEGYAQLLLRWLGPIAGRIALFLYAAFFLFYTGFIFRSGSERLVAAIYPESPLFPFMLVMMGLCLLVSLGTVRALGRTAFFLRSFLLISLGLILLFAAPNLERGNLTPIPWEDLGGIALGALPIAAIGGLAGAFPFLMGYVEPVAQPGRRAVPTLLFLLALAGILSLEVIGTFGAALVQRLSYPFFLMVRDISVFHITQRIEALVVVLWMFADFILCVSMLRCAYEALRTALTLPEPDSEPLRSLRKGRWLLCAEAAAVLLCSRLIARSTFDLAVIADRVIPLAGFCFIYIGLALCWCVGRLRKKAALRRDGRPK